MLMRLAGFSLVVWIGVTAALGQDNAASPAGAADGWKNSSGTGAAESAASARAFSSSDASAARSPVRRAVPTGSL